MSSGQRVFVVRPGGGLVVEGPGLEAAVQDADEPAGELAQGSVVLGAAGALGVVQGAGAGRGAEGGEGLGHERVGEPVVEDEPGGEDLLLARRAGDRGGAGVVLAGLAAGIPVRVVAEFAEHPGAEDGSQAGLGQVDLSVRVPAKIRLHLPLQGLDLLIQGGDHRDQGPDGDRVGGGDSLGLAQLRTAQRGHDRGRLAGDVAAAGALERRADLGAGQPPCPGRVLPSSSSASGASRSAKAASAAGKYSRSWCRSRCTYRVRSQISVLWARATTLTAPASALSPATARS